MTFTEHDHEPVKGLPAPLPAGERILWQGAPRWRSLFAHACYLRALTVYFGLIVVWQVTVAFYDGGGASAAVGRASWIVLMWAGLLGILAFYCLLVVRTTVYTVTDRRLVMRVGVAVPITLNLPFTRIDGAGLRLFGGGTGNVVLTVKPDDRVAFLVLWPHCRPWHLARPQPMLRSVADAQRVAEILGGALTADEARRAAAKAAETPDAQETEVAMAAGAPPGRVVPGAPGSTARSMSGFAGPAAAE